MDRLCTVLFIAILCLVHGELEFTTITNGSYVVSFNKAKWLSSTFTYFHVNGKYYSNRDKSLNLTLSSSSSGLDSFGPWQNTAFTYNADGTIINCKIRSYQTDLIPAIIFTQEFVNGAKGTQASTANKTVGGFPSFKILDVNSEVGYLSYASYMFGDRKKTLGVWGPSTVKIRDGLDGSGPLILFDKRGNTLLFAPFNNALVGSINYNKTYSSISWGIMGGIAEIPAGYTYSTIMIYSENGGINDVFDKWGKLMQYYYGKNKDYQTSDLTLTHMGYWTDNGGYYYYNTEQSKNYEQTMLDVKKNIKDSKIPFKYIQLDSWWYYKDKNKAVTKWEAKPKIFPSGMKTLGDELGLPLALHNRYWSKDTPYAEKYFFLKGLGLSVPINTQFWDFLFKRAKTWGLVLYEQDWMNVQFMFLNEMKTNLTLASTWLDALATSAENNQLTIQYCMTQSRMALQSIKYSVVTQARVSDDYHLQHDQWKIGITSLFADAMGLAPSKDTFWTTTNQPNNPYNTTEPYPALQTLIAVLSTGPVGPSDGIGNTNKQLLMKCCNADGLILKPRKPATAINDQIIENAFKDGNGADGEVWTTYSDFGPFDQIRYGIIMVANLSKPYSITPSKASFNLHINRFPASVIYDSTNIMNNKSFSDTDPYVLPKCLLTSHQYCLFYTSTIIQRGNSTIILFGETTKFVWMSPQRVYKLWIDDNNVAVTLRGAPSENVTFVYSINGDIKTTFNIIDPKTECVSIILYSAGGTPIIPKDLDCKVKPVSYPKPGKHHRGVPI